MTKEQIFAGESKNTEFKICRPENSLKYIKTVVAFANGKGGKIIFGIEDTTKDIAGIPEEIIFQEIDAITNAISDSCEPVIVPDVYPQTIDGKNIIIAEISAGRQKPYYIKKDGITDGVYIRVSGTTRKADKAITQEMFYESEGRSYDTVIRKDLTVSEKDIETLCLEMKNVALANCKNDSQRQMVKDVTKNILLKWGILAEEGSKIYPTNAYIFLTGQDPFLSKIQCGMFKGNTREIFVDKRDYEGPLWKQIEEAFKFVLRNIRLGAKIEGVYRKDIYEFPPNSIRELIVNAVMNCSFLQSSHIQVAIYDNRLEVTSPGGLMPGVTIQRMKEGYSQIRNRALSHAFSYMNIIEGWGTGIPRLLKEIQEYGLAEPEFIDMEIALRINIYKNDAAFKVASETTNLEVHSPDYTSYQPTNQANQATNQGNQAKNIKELNQIQKDILEFIKKDSHISQSMIAKNLGIKTNVVKFQIEVLKKNEIIKREGTSQKGCWKINSFYTTEADV